MGWGIKFRPIKPASPHLNGKVARSQHTDLVEFYATVDVKDPALPNLLAEREVYYNWHRSHSSLNGMPPSEKQSELADQTPYWEDVGMAYHHDQERIILQNYAMDQAIKQLKPSL